MNTHTDLVQHPMQLIFSLNNTITIIAVYHKNKSLCVLEVVSPQGSNLKHPHGTELLKMLNLKNRVVKMNYDKSVTITCTTVFSKVKFQSDLIIPEASHKRNILPFILFQFLFYTIFRVAFLTRFGFLCRNRIYNI